MAGMLQSAEEMNGGRVSLSTSTLKRYWYYTLPSYPRNHADPDVSFTPFSRNQNVDQILGLHL